MMCGNQMALSANMATRISVTTLQARIMRSFGSSRSSRRRSFSDTTAPFASATTHPNQSTAVMRAPTSCNEPGVGSVPVSNQRDYFDGQILSLIVSARQLRSRPNIAIRA